MFETLVDYAPASTRLEPELAESWNVSPDAQTYTFHLRAGLAYSDGSPVVAADFVSSLDRALATAESPFAPFLANVTGSAAVIAGKAAHATGLSAPSEREFVVHLEHPDAAFIAVLAMSFATPQRADHIAAAFQ